jgi:hypothetical protein
MLAFHAVYKSGLMLSWFKGLALTGKAVVILAALSLLFGMGFGVKSCYTSTQINNTQEEINQGREQISNSQVEQWVANENAKDAAKEAERASNASKQAKQAANVKPKENVAFEEANKNRCEAYKDSKECK